MIDSISFIKSTYLNEHITIAKDDSENLWIGRSFSVFCYLKDSNYKKYIAYHFRQSAKAIFKDQSNTIWISLAKDEFRKAKLYSIKKGFYRL